MPASLSGVFNLQQFTDSGAPANGHRLYTYSFGTTTQKIAYTEPGGTISHAYTSDGVGGLYIALNSRGELPAPLFLTAGPYDIALKTPAGATAWTRYAKGGDDVGDALRADLASTSDAAKGDALVGFIAAGTGAVARTIKDKARETISISDRATPASTAISNVVGDIKASGGGSFIAGALSYTLASGVPLSITGGVPVIGGIAFDGKYAPVTSPNNTTNAYRIGNFTGSVASQYRNEFSIKNLSAIGAGKTGTSAGIYQVDAADVRIDGAIIRNFAYGFRGESALSSDYHNITVTGNGTGISAIAGTGLTLAQPNALHFYGARVYENDRAVSVIGGPNASMLWASSQFEGNNLAGNNTDGRAVIALTNAGEQVFISTHHEGNLGQYGTYYDAQDFTKTMTMLGVQHIDGTATGVHIQTGTLLAMGSRINNALAVNDIFLNTGASATLIETETGTINGDKSNLAVLRFGKLGFGSLPVRSSPCIIAADTAIANAASNVVSRFSSNTVRHEWANTADTLLGYHAWYNALDTEFYRSGLFGFGFFSNNVKILNVGRVGNITVEPGSDNLITLGSAPFRWKEIFSANAVINTSDARLKTDDRSLSSKERAVAIKAKALLKAFKYKDAVREKGSKARIHFGLYAQELKAAFESEGLDARDYSVLCFDEWAEESEKLGKDGNIKQPRIAAGNQWGVRYEELLVFIIAAL